MKPEVREAIAGMFILYSLAMVTISIPPDEVGFDLGPQYDVQIMTAQQAAQHQMIWRYVVPENNEIRTTTGVPYVWDKPDGPAFAEKVK